MKFLFFLFFLSTNLSAHVCDPFIASRNVIYVDVEGECLISDKTPLTSLNHVGTDKSFDGDIAIFLADNKTAYLINMNDLLDRYTAYSGAPPCYDLEDDLDD